jgi:hypothetical protein
MNEREQPPRFCPTCGAKTVPGVSHCPSCGQPLAKREEIARLWGVDLDAPPPDESSIIDLYPETPASLQATTPFTQTRAFQPSDRRGTGDTAPWSSGGDTLSKRSTPSASPSPPPAIPVKPGGPHGCVLGCLALLIIGVVGALLAWGAVRPLISDRVEDEVSIGLTNELRQIDTIPVTSGGRITLIEDEINADLEQHSAEYEPIEQASVAISEEGIAITFELYGVSSTYRSGLTVENGRLTVVDPSLSGPAGRIIDADEIGAVFERDVAELLRRSNLQPTSVRLREDSIVITTAPTT